MQSQANGKKETRERRHLRLLIYITLPATGFGLAFALFTGQWLSSFITSYAISGTIALLREFDVVLIQPRLQGLPRDRRLVLEIVTAFVENVCGALLAWTVCWLIFGFDVTSASIWFWLVLIGSLFVISLIFQSVGYAWRFYQELKEKELTEERLRTLATEAELKALKAQINPHFLFNTLNTIAQLIHSQPVQAEMTVERLAEMLRYTLAVSERRLVSVGEELAFVDGYLEIEQARYGKRLRITREIASGAFGTPVPGLILQPLVENAIRHGQGADGSVDLRIGVYPDGDEVVITITDQGPGMPPRDRIGSGGGVGLRNVDERLRKTYGEGYGLDIAPNTSQGTVVTIRVPAGGGI